MALFPLRIGCKLFAALLIAFSPVALRTVEATPAPAPQAQLADAARRGVGDDTAIVHRELRKSIERFQDSWRKTWQKAEAKRHRNINLSQIRGWNVRGDGIIEEPTWDGDRAAMNMTPDLRRYLAILCNIDSPSDQQIEYTKARKNWDIGTPTGFKAQPLGANARGAATTLRSSVFQTELSFLSPRIIQAAPNFASICPAWIPPDERLPLDEGEAIDLAIPPNIREPLRRERETLITLLVNAQAKYPNDEWIAGQAFRFILDQRSPARALRAAESCQTTEKFCSALMGLALAQSGKIAAAEKQFRVIDSLETLQTDRVGAPCIHAEILLLIPPGDRTNVMRGSCTEQQMFVERLWWLADPLWSVPGNERYLAHASRRFHGSLRAVLDRDERYTWARLGGGEAFRELLVRYGWPAYTYWPGVQLEEEINKVRENPARPRFLFPPYTAVEYSTDRTALIPAIAAIQQPFRSVPEHWDLRMKDPGAIDTWWPQEHMMLWMQLHQLPSGQQVQWRRDSTIVFGMTVDNPLFALDTAGRGPSPAALVASTGSQDLRLLARTTVEQGQALRLRGQFAPQPLVMSAEIAARTQREPAHRLRFGLHPDPSLQTMKAGEVAISQPVFMSVASREAALPNNADAASLFMTGRLEFSRSESLALFWESYGFSPDDSVQFELRINRNDDVNFARRVGAALGVASALRDSVSIRWAEADARSGGASILLAAKPVIGRAVALDVNALPAGTYIVSMEMRGKNGQVARNDRPFVLR